MRNKFKYFILTLPIFFLVNIAFSDGTEWQMKVTSNGTTQVVKNVYFISFPNSVWERTVSEASLRNLVIQNDTNEMIRG
jgi:hypothetical protein